MNDAEVIRFVNEHTRQAADKFAVAYIEAISHLASFDAIKDKIPNDNTLIEDGRQAEGISQISCAEVYGLVALINSVQTAMDANNGLLKKLVFKISVHKGG